jgi:hypothetical protein
VAKATTAYVNVERVIATSRRSDTAMARYTPVILHPPC